jgi:hypothetical protein
VAGSDRWGDDGARTRNRVDENSGTTVQAGQVHGDVNVGGSTVNSRTTIINLPAVSVVTGAVVILVVGFAVWKFVAAKHSPQVTSRNPTHGSTTSTPTQISVPAAASPGERGAAAAHNRCGSRREPTRRRRKRLDRPQPERGQPPVRQQEWHEHQGVTTCPLRDVTSRRVSGLLFFDLFSERS